MLENLRYSVEIEPSTSRFDYTWTVLKNSQIGDFLIPLVLNPEGRGKLVVPGTPVTAINAEN